jgi:DNA-binding transcriptional ArsR family regulator
MVTMKQARHPAPDEITLIDVMGALNDPIRVGLVRVLADGREHGWGELRAPVAKSTLSHHLRVLRDAGVTRTRQEGTRCFVELRRDDLDARFPGLLNAVLGAAHRDDVGAHVGLADDPPPA